MLKYIYSTFSSDAMFEIYRGLDCVLIGRPQPVGADVSVAENLFCVRVCVDKPSVSLILLKSNLFLI